MSIFQKCPTCGTFAFVQPSGIFRCNNGHVFKTTEKEKNDVDEVWKSMPEWARMLKKVAP